MYGLAINIATFAYLLKMVDFNAIVDHLALLHILISKTEPATTRIKRLLEVLITYSFNLCDNYLLVVAPGTLGMVPATLLGQVS